jgi:hypothetical protein
MKALGIRLHNGTAKSLSLAFLLAWSLDLGSPFLQRLVTSIATSTDCPRQALRLGICSVKNGKWSAAVQFTPSEVKRQSKDRAYGCIGIDMNPGSIGWSYVDTEGNLKAHGQIPLEMGLPSGKQQAQIVDACLYAANLAICFACPVVCEELDFADKKERLGEQGKKYARMLSSWAYSEFFRQLNSVLSNRGIERLHGQSCLQFNDWAGEVHENVRTSQ